MVTGKIMDNNNWTTITNTNTTKISRCSGTRWDSEDLLKFITTDSRRTLRTFTSLAISRTWITSTKGLTSTRPSRITSRKTCKNWTLLSKARTWLFKKDMISLRPNKFSWKTNFSIRDQTIKRKRKNIHHVVNVAHVLFVKKSFSQCDKQICIVWNSSKLKKERLSFG